MIEKFANFPFFYFLWKTKLGILTGSVYKDYGLLKSGFPAESISNGSVLVVKTHEWGPNSWNRFSRAILLVRDPAKAILAEFNRQSGGHVGFASPDRYKRTKGRCKWNLLDCPLTIFVSQIPKPFNHINFHALNFQFTLHNYLPHPNNLFFSKMGLMKVSS